jgi:hypothetical protein
MAKERIGKGKEAVKQDMIKYGDNDRKDDGGDTQSQPDPTPL